MSRSCSSVPISKKAEILRELLETGASQKFISQKHSIPRQTLNSWMKKKDEIFTSVDQSNFHTKRKRMRKCVDSDIEDCLLKWFKQKRSENVPLSGPILISKANDFAASLGRDEWKCSESWLERFKARHGISVREICGEGNSAPVALLNQWKETTLQSILSDYSPDDIYNSDETALFWQCLPDKTLAFKGQKCTGGKLSKNRVSILLTVNMSGTDKRELLVIGKYANPRCFKGNYVFILLKIYKVR